MLGTVQDDRNFLCHMCSYSSHGNSLGFLNFSDNLLQLTLISLYSYTNNSKISMTIVHSGIAIKADMYPACTGSLTELLECMLVNTVSGSCSDVCYMAA